MPAIQRKLTALDRVRHHRIAQQSLKPHYDLALLGAPKHFFRLGHRQHRFTRVLEPCVEMPGSAHRIVVTVRQNRHRYCIHGCRRGAAAMICGANSVSAALQTRTVPATRRAALPAARFAARRAPYASAIIVGAVPIPKASMVTAAWSSFCSNAPITLTVMHIA